MRRCRCGALAANPPTADVPECWFHMALGSIAEQAMALPALPTGPRSTAYAEGT
jgi:hypothetical protein